MVIGQLWLKMFNSDYGVINTVIRYFVPEYEHSWLTKNAFMTVLIPSVWQYIGYHMIIFYAGIKSISTDYYEAAQIDGASTWQEYLYVRIPYIKPVIIANCLLVLNGSLRSFEFSYLLTHGGPGNASELMTTYMYKQAFSSMKYGYGSSVAIMIVIICMVVGMLFRKFTGGGDDE